MKVTNLNKFALICLAAGKSQLPVIEKAKSLGYTIVAIDRNREADGFKYADYKIFGNVIFFMCGHILHGLINSTFGFST